MQTFFDTLNVAATVVRKILENDVVQAIAKVLGPITGFVLAFGLLKIILVAVGNFILYVLIVAFNALATIFGVVSTAVKIFIGVFRALSAVLIANPIAAVVLLIVGLVAIFVTLYKKNEAFRELVDRVWAAIKNAIGIAVDAIVAYFKMVIEFGMKLWGWIFDTLEVVWNLVWGYFKTVYTIWKTVVEIIIGIGLIIWDFLYDKIVAVWELVSGWWNDTILPFITGIVETVAEFGAAIWDWIYDKIMAVWNTVKGFWDTTIYPFVSGVVKAVKTEAGAIWDFISGGISARGVR
jgi:phage-related protein